MRGRGSTELFLRLNYLASISWASLGLIVLLVYPFNGPLLTPIALATALPYFVAMSSDLKRCGYKRTDVLRIYGVQPAPAAGQLVGALKSIGQAIGGQKIAFARTPKVRNRRRPLMFVSSPYLIVAFSLLTGWLDVHHDHYTHAAYAAVNALLCAYALVAFIGIRHSLVDLWVNTVQYLYRSRDDRSERTDDELDWATVLFAGASDGMHGLPIPASQTLTDFPGHLGPSRTGSATGYLESGPNPDERETTDVLAEHVRDLLDRGRLGAPHRRPSARAHRPFARRSEVQWQRVNVACRHCASSARSPLRPGWRPAQSLWNGMLRPASRKRWDPDRGTRPTSTRR